MHIESTPATQKNIAKLMAVVRKVTNVMQSRKEIQLLEMSKIAESLEEATFKIESLPTEDQENLGLMLIYLLKYTSGVDEDGNYVNRFGAHNEGFQRQIAKATLTILSNNPKFQQNHFKVTKQDIREFNLGQL